MANAQVDYHQLIEAHQQRLVRWCYARVHDRDVAADLAQRTWVEVLPRIHTYDPQRASFWTFTKIWASFVVKRHWAQTTAQLAVQDAPVGDDVDDGADPMDRHAAEQPRPDEIAELREASEMHLALLRQTLSCKRLPHEIIAFAIVKLLDWTPKRVVAEFSDAALQTAATLLESEYFQHVQLAEVHDAFQPLRAALAKTIAASDLDARITRPYHHLADQVTGTTVVREYYPPDDDPEAAVTRWWAAVNRVVRQDLLHLSQGRLAEWLRERGLARLPGKKVE